VAIIVGLCFPFSIAMYTSYEKYATLMLFVFPAFAGAAYIAPALAMTQALVTLRMRAQASAILLLILNLIGMGMGPQLAGILSDVYNPAYGDESLRYALLTISVVWIWAATHFFLAARTLKQDIERARQHGLAS
jgi:MFS family permease